LLVAGDSNADDVGAPAADWHCGQEKPATPRNVSAQVSVPAAMFSAAIPVSTLDIRDVNDSYAMIHRTGRRHRLCLSLGDRCEGCGSVLTTDRPCSRR
jgi:hypothetical protein